MDYYQIYIQDLELHIVCTVEDEALQLTHTHSMALMQVGTGTGTGTETGNYSRYWLIQALKTSD